MSELIIAGDDHTRDEEPFLSVKEHYFDWFASQSFNNENNYFVHVGDFFHRKKPSPKENALALKFFSKLKFKKMYMLVGNGLHEYNRAKNCYAVDPLQELPNMEIIYEPEVIEIGGYIPGRGLKCLFLPSIPDGKFDNLKMSEYYEKYLNNLKEKGEVDYDYTFGHFFHKNGFGEEISLDMLNTRIRMGHYHIPTDDLEYVGINTITRKDEAGIKPTINIVDLDTKKERLINIPIFLDYYSVTYPDNIIFHSSYSLLTVHNAPDEETIVKKYIKCNVFLHEWFKEKIIVDSEDSDDNTVTKTDSISDYLKQYCKVKKTPTNIVTKLKELIGVEE